MECFERRKVRIGLRQATSDEIEQPVRTDMQIAKKDLKMPIDVRGRVCAIQTGVAFRHGLLDTLHYVSSRIVGARPCCASCKRFQHAHQHVSERTGLCGRLSTRATK